jgi:hypothetical protein
MRAVRGKVAQERMAGDQRILVLMLAKVKKFPNLELLELPIALRLSERSDDGPTAQLSLQR